MKAKGLIPFLCAAVLMFSGCSLSRSGTELLHPPKTTGNEAEIEKLIEETAKGDYMLKYPNSGEYRSAIVTHDLDGDQKNEAIAFYRTNGSDPVTHMLIMSDTEKGWKISCNYETQYTDIDCISFTDYDFDGYDEILSGFATYTSNVNELTVFDYDVSTKTASPAGSTAQYTGFTTGDYDGDGGNEIMLLTLSTADTRSNATLMDYDKNQLYFQSSCPMDGTVTKYESISTVNVGKNNTAVIVEGVLESTYNTQVIIFDESKLKITSCTSTGERTQPVKSRDIDGDGFVEIPKISASPISKNTDSSAAAPMITWCKFNSDAKSFSDSIYSFANFDYGYSLTVPENLKIAVMGVMSTDKRTLDIYRLKGNKSDGHIATVKIFNSGKASSDYTVIKSHKLLDYCCKISDDEALDTDTLKENFALLEETLIN